MKSYCYDGSFTGFLTVAAATEGSWNSVEVTRSVPLQGGLFAACETVPEDGERAESIYCRIGRRISPEAQRLVYHAFLSDAPGVETALLRYLDLGMRMGARVDDLLADERVSRVQRLARQVRHEAHRLKGFVRFQEVRGGLFYAGIEPEWNVLSLVVPHFVGRFADQDWIIHDLRRDRGALYHARTGRWVLTSLSVTGDVEGTDREAAFQGVWRSYFTAGSIEGRRNLKLQRSKVPLKYRRHLVEFQEDPHLRTPLPAATPVRD